MFDCVIPAAGASSRMLAFKPLLPFGSGTVVGATVASALSAGCRVLLVVGNRGAELAALFESKPDVVVVENPLWERGMLGSLQAALDQVRGQCFFTIPADMPLVKPSVYGLLAHAREVDLAAGAAEASYFASSSGRAGHPVLVPSLWIGEILELPPSGRMKSFLEGRPRVLVEAGSDAVLTDLDRPEDYRAAIARDWPGVK